MLYIRCATVFTPYQEIREGAVLLDGPQIVAVGTPEQVPCPAGAELIDATELLLTPGFIDLQINGAFGHDFTADPSSIWPVAELLPRYGITAFLPTIITSPPETVAVAQQIITQVPATGARGAIPLGLHIEGPFLNPQKVGAHNPALLRPPDLAAVRNWSPERGVRLVTLAPELPGAMDLIHALLDQGVTISAGHSTATFEEAKAGFDAGIRYGTHLFNAMPPLHHRRPRLVGALLSDERTTVGMIVDGIHIHPSMVHLAWRALGPRRLNLVTDAMAALGMAPGTHRLADSSVVVDGSSARLADGTLAGSILSLDGALRNLMDFVNCPLAQAVPTVTSTAADVLGLGGSRGCVAPGYAADLVLLTPDLEVHTTIVSGKVVYTHPQNGASLGGQGRFRQS
jgi:N-acetylglucosamine-6-phosphate deacetylase